MAAGFRSEHRALGFYQGMDARKAGFVQEGTSSTIDGARVARNEESQIANIMARRMKVVRHEEPDGTTVDGYMNARGKLVEKIDGVHTELDRGVIDEVNAHYAEIERTLEEYIKLWTTPGNLYCVLTGFPLKSFEAINKKGWNPRSGDTRRFFRPGFGDEWDDTIDANTSPSYLQICSRRNQSIAFEKVRAICMNLMPRWKPVLYGGAIPDRSTEGPDVSEIDQRAVAGEAAEDYQGARRDARRAAQDQARAIAAAGGH